MIDFIGKIWQILKLCVIYLTFLHIYRHVRGLYFINLSSLDRWEHVSNLQCCNNFLIIVIFFHHQENSNPFGIPIRASLHLAHAQVPSVPFPWVPGWHQEWKTSCHASTHPTPHSPSLGSRSKRTRENQGSFWSEGNGVGTERVRKDAFDLAGT